MNNIEIAKTYYNAVGVKNIDGIAKFLHPDVQFSGPLAKLKGKDAVLDATKNFANMFTSLKVRLVAGTNDQVILVYDLEFPEPIGNMSSSVLMTFKDGLVTNLELFYDARPFEKKKEEIFK